MLVKQGFSGRIVLSWTMALALFCYSTVADAYSVKYRYSANICQLEAEPSPWNSNSLERFWNGLRIADSDGVPGSGNVDWVICPLPTGPTLVEATDAHGVVLHKVRVNGKYIGPSGEAVEGLLEFADDSSEDFCTCDDEEWVGSYGEFYLDLSFDGCVTGCTSIDTNWVMNVEVGMGDLVGGSENGLDLYSLNVYQ